MDFCPTLTRKTIRKGPYLQVEVAQGFCLAAVETVPLMRKQCGAVTPTAQTSQIRCGQACSSFFRLGGFSFESCTASFRVSLSSLPFRKASAPEASFSQSTFHDVSLADVQTSGLPDRFCLGHRRRRTHIRQHNSHVSHLLGSVPRSR